MSSARMILAERLRAPDGAVGAVRLPLDVAGRASPLLAVALATQSGERRSITLPTRDLPRGASLRLSFEPLRAPSLLLVALEVREPLAPADLSAWIAELAPGARGRAPIVLETAPAPASPHLAGVGAMVALVEPPPAVEVAWAVEAGWRDASGAHVRGWVHAHGAPVRRVVVSIGESAVALEELGPRPDLVRHYPALPPGARAAFSAYVPGPADEPLLLRVETSAGARSVRLELPRQTPGSEEERWPALFLELAKARGGVVLEIGARRVSPGAGNVRALCAWASRFVGFDVHPSPDVDVVGDAHALSTAVGEEAIDTILSESVLEHLEAPWVVAREINRALRPGGLVYHRAPHSWPVHESPNDFWRFSDEGLKTLFGPASGFEVLEAGLTSPLALVPGVDWRRGAYLDLPLNPGYASAYVVARKVRHLAPGEVTWPLASDAARARAASYPLRTS